MSLGFEFGVWGMSLGFGQIYHQSANYYLFSICAIITCAIFT